MRIMNFTATVLQSDAGPTGPRGERRGIVSTPPSGDSDAACFFHSNDPEEQEALR